MASRADLVLGRDVTVRLINLPDSTDAAVARDEEGHCNVYVNAKLPRERQKVAFLHEVAHIWRGDYDSNESIHEIENDAHF